MPAIFWTTDAAIVVLPCAVSSARREGKPMVVVGVATVDVGAEDADAEVGVVISDSPLLGRWCSSPGHPAVAEAGSTPRRPIAMRDERSWRQQPRQARGVALLSEAGGSVPVVDAQRPDHENVQRDDQQGP